jgi:hypothetical protein
MVANHGWREFNTNFLREYARCTKGNSFSNDESPDIYREVIKRRPDLAKRIVINQFKRRK